MTGLVKLGSRVHASGTLTCESAEGFRALLHLLETNGASATVLDLSAIAEMDSEGVAVVKEFLRWQPQMSVASPSARAKAELASIGIAYQEVV